MSVSGPVTVRPVQASQPGLVPLLMLSAAGMLVPATNGFMRRYVEKVLDAASPGSPLLGAFSPAGDLVGAVLLRLTGSGESTSSEKLFLLGVPVVGLMALASIGSRGPWAANVCAFTGLALLMGVPLWRHEAKDRSSVAIELGAVTAAGTAGGAMLDIVWALPVAALTVLFWIAGRTMSVYALVLTHEERIRTLWFYGGAVALFAPLAVAFGAGVAGYWTIASVCVAVGVGAGWVAARGHRRAAAAVRPMFDDGLFAVAKPWRGSPLVPTAPGQPRVKISDALLAGAVAAALSGPHATTPVRLGTSNDAARAAYRSIPGGLLLEKTLLQGETIFYRP
jgi:hypothetical protein